MTTHAWELVDSEPSLAMVSFHTDVQQWIISTPGVVTNSHWKYFTIFYGPDNLAECLPGVDLEDGIRNCSEEGPYKLEV